jgi:hypothetical protein
MASQPRMAPVAASRSGMPPRRPRSMRGHLKQLVLTKSGSQAPSPRAAPSGPRFPHLGRQSEADGPYGSGVVLVEDWALPLCMERSSEPAALACRGSCLNSSSFGLVISGTSLVAQPAPVAVPSPLRVLARPSGAALRTKRKPALTPSVGQDSSAAAHTSWPGRGHGVHGGSGHRPSDRLGDAERSSP